MKATIIWNNIDNDEEINILKKVVKVYQIDIFNGSLDEIATNLLNAFTESGWNLVFKFIDPAYIDKFLKTERTLKRDFAFPPTGIGGRKKTKKKRKGYSMKINKKRKKRRSKKRKNSRSNFKGR